VNRSGRICADAAAIGEPQSWPMIAARSAPSARTTATLSATWASIRYASTGSGRRESPYPRTSIAAARYPAAASAGS
jgi:hypothetical protein